MNEIERQATEAWGTGTRAIAAYDFMQIVIPAEKPDSQSSRPAGHTMQLQHADPDEGLLYVDNRGHSNRGKRRKF